MMFFDFDSHNSLIHLANCILFDLSVLDAFNVTIHFSLMVNTYVSAEPFILHANKYAKSVDEKKRKKTVIRIVVLS